jgi:hypothetical protein
MKVALVVLAVVAGATAGTLVALSRGSPDAPEAPESIVTASDEETPTVASGPPEASAAEEGKPVASGVIEARLGPNEDYQVLGTLAKGQRLEVLGRDETSSWLAVQMGVGLTGWIPATSVTGLADASSLALVQPKLLPVPTSPPAAVVPEPRQPASAGASSSGTGAATSPGSSSGAASGSGSAASPARPAAPAPTTAPAVQQETRTQPAAAAPAAPTAPTPVPQQEPRVQQAAPTTAPSTSLCDRGYRNARERDEYFRVCR